MSISALEAAMQMRGLTQEERDDAIDACPDVIDLRPRLDHATKQRDLAVAYKLARNPAEPKPT